MESNTPLDRQALMIKFWSKVRPTNPCGAFVLHPSSWTDSQGPDGRLTPTPTTQSGCFILRHFPIIRSYLLVLFQFSSVQSLNHIQLFETPGLQHSRLLCPSPTPGTYSNSCPSSESVTPSNHLIFCHPLFPPSIFPSNRVFSDGSVLPIR